MADDRYYQRARSPVEVQVIHSADGESTPVMIMLKKRPYHIFSCKKIGEERDLLGAVTETYRVRINGQYTHLYFKEGIWFVREKRYVDQIKT